MGEQWISSSLAGILIATVPLSVVVIAPLFGVKERLGALRIAGLAIGFCGVIAIVGSGYGARADALGRRRVHHDFGRRLCDRAAGRAALSVGCR